MVVSVCIGSACHISGSYEIIGVFKKCIKEDDLGDKITLKASFCTGNCKDAVCVTVDSERYSVKPSDAKDFFDRVIRRQA